VSFLRNLRSFNILQPCTWAQRLGPFQWRVASLVRNLSASKGFDDRTEWITLFGRVKTVVLGEPRNQAIQSFIRELIRCRVIPIVLAFVSNQVPFEFVSQFLRRDVPLFATAQGADKEREKQKGGRDGEQPCQGMQGG